MAEYAAPEEYRYMMAKGVEAVIQPKIVVAPADVDVSPHVSVHMKGPSLAAFWAMSALGHSIQDFAKFTAQMYLINRMKNEFIPNAANLPMSFSYEAKRLSLDELAGAVLRKINSDYDYLVYAWNTGIQTGLGGGFSSFQEQFLASSHLLNAYGTMQYQISIAPRMRRYWMKEYTPTVPNTSMAFNLFRRGKLTAAQFVEYASYDGWDSNGIDFLKALWKAIPNEATAFRMMMRGVIDEKTKNLFYYANSWEPEDFDKLDAIYQDLPSGRQGFSLYRRGDIKAEQFLYLMQADGFTAAWRQYLPKLWEKIPSARDAFRMYMREAITESDFDKYVEANEWEKGSEAKFWAIWQNLPSSREAFTLYRRGKIDDKTLTALFKADGYMPTYQKIVSTLYERILTVRQAYTLYMRGRIDKKTYDSLIYQNRFVDGSADLLYNIFQRLPTAREAFYMWRKGLITLNQRNMLYQSAGYDPVWHERLTANNEYIPTVYDLTRIADYVEVDSIWATEILKMRGLRDRDISKITQMLKIRPLRDEIRRQITIWVRRYRYGWIDPTELEAALQWYLDNGWIQSTEKDMTTEEATLNYEDELMSEQISIFEWYFRTAIITEEDLKNDLLALGIREEKVNLMVELLKAQGYYGYY